MRNRKSCPPIALPVFDSPPNVRLHWVREMITRRELTASVLVSCQGDRTKFVSLSAVDDGVPEGDQEFFCELSGVDSGAKLNALRRKATVVIRANDKASGVLSIDQATRNLVVGEPQGNYDGEFVVRWVKGQRHRTTTTTTTTAPTGKTRRETTTCSNYTPIQWPLTTTMSTHTSNNVPLIAISARGVVAQYFRDAFMQTLQADLGNTTWCHIDVTAFSRRFWRAGYLLWGVGWVTPECRKTLWGPLGGDGQTFQGGSLVSRQPQRRAASFLVTTRFRA